MKTWSWIVLAACAAAVVILIGSSVAEARGLIESKWLGPLARMAGRDWRPPGGFVEANAFVDAVAGLVSHMLVGILVIFAVPRFVRRVADSFAGGTRTLVRYLFTGVLMAAALGAIALLTAFYIHLFPLPIVLVFAFLLAALGGVVSLEYEMGRELLRRAGRPAASPVAGLALGTLLVFATTRIPYLGPWLLALLWLTGAGAVLATKFGSGGRWSLAALQEERPE
jgi:hypothetical protein